MLSSRLPCRQNDDLDQEPPSVLAVLEPVDFGESALVSVLVEVVLVVLAESASLVERAAVAGGMRSLWDDGIAKAAAGLISLEELARVVSTF